MITREQAISFNHGEILHHTKLKNADGTALRARVNGKCRTWKTRPEEFLLPMKHGMYTCFYINQNNCAEWVNRLEE